MGKVENTELRTTIWSVNIEAEPKPQGSKNAFVKDGKAVLVEASKGVHTWRTAVTKAAKFQPPATQFNCPVWIVLEFYLTQAPSNRKDKPSQKPDLDKLIRSTLDALVQAGIMTDDQIITKISASKRWAKDRASGKPGVYVVVAEDTTD